MNYVKNKYLHLHYIQMITFTAFLSCLKKKKNIYIYVHKYQALIHTSIHS